MHQYGGMSRWMGAADAPAWGRSRLMSAIHDATAVLSSTRAVRCGEEGVDAMWCTDIRSSVAKGELCFFV
jgi:hypothetical protein